jgi:hypothetical protein
MWVGITEILHCPDKRFKCVEKPCSYLPCYLCYLYFVAHTNPVLAFSRDGELPTEVCWRETEARKLGDSDST